MSITMSRVVSQLALRTAWLAASPHVLSRSPWAPPRFWRTLVVAVVAVSSAERASAQAGNRVTHGPILGRVGAHEISVWARTFRAGPFRVRYGKSADRLDQISAPVTTTVDHDNAAVVTLAGLDADATYFYELALGAGDAATPAIQRNGSFHTLPDAEDVRDAKYNPKGLFNFSFQYGHGNNQAAVGLGPALPTFRKMLEQKVPERVNFAVLNGDWIYEERREFPPDQWLKDVGITPANTPSVVALAPTITGVWENYKLYLERGTNLSLWHRNVPSYFTMDDHEMLNDMFGSGTAGFRNRRAAFRDIGTQAWYDYLGWSNPPASDQGILFGQAEMTKGSDILVDRTRDFTTIDLAKASNLMVHWGGATAGVHDVALDGVGGDPNSGAYDIVERLDAHRLRIRPSARETSRPAYSIGRKTYSRMRVSNADIFYLDTRSYKDVYDVKNPGKPGVSMLGAKQKAWLKEEMRASDAQMFFVFSSVNLSIPHVGTSRGAANSAAEAERDDAWTAYLEERAEMIKYWEGLGKPVFVITGDLHNSFAINISDKLWEFAAGPHNSRNHGVEAEGNRPPNGPFSYGGLNVNIRWSSFFLEETPTDLRTEPIYGIVQVNNVFTNRKTTGKNLTIAFPRPQVIFQFYSGLTGALLYAESIVVGN